MKHIISAYNFSRDELEDIFALTDKYSKNLNDTRKILSGKTISIAFFEPSTRTYLSFQKAIINLGGDVIGFSGEESTSVAKGENLADTIRMLNNYSDGIVMRHKYDGASRFASEISDIPVINAGDGKHEHPTQAVIDIYTINKHFNTIDGLVFALLGDLKYARTVNSLLRILTR